MLLGCLWFSLGKINRETKEAPACFWQTKNEVHHHPRSNTATLAMHSGPPPLCRVLAHLLALALHSAHHSLGSCSELPAQWRWPHLQALTCKFRGAFGRITESWLRAWRGKAREPVQRVVDVSSGTIWVTQTPELRYSASYTIQLFGVSVKSRFAKAVCRVKTMPKCFTYLRSPRPALTYLWPVASFFDWAIWAFKSARLSAASLDFSADSSNVSCLFAEGYAACSDGEEKAFPGPDLW